MEREIQNINTGRTLNFVFRQMNQEFITVLHLVGARVAFMYGDLVETTRVVDLPSLDDLLNEVVNDGPDPSDKDAFRKDIKEKIRTILENIFDYQDERQTLIEEVPLGAGPRTYLRVQPEKQSEVGGVTVSGIVLSLQRNVLRTDGLIVEALLGEGIGLDAYSEGLQTEQVRARQLANAIQKARIEREQLAQSIFAKGDASLAELFDQAYGQTALGGQHS